MLPFFASNGCIVTARTGWLYDVSTPLVGVTVDTDWPKHPSGDWFVDVPSTWHHTDEERQTAVDAALAAVGELKQSEAFNRIIHA